MKEVLYEERCLKSNEDMILALHLFSNTALHTTFLSYYIPFTGKHEPNKLTCSPTKLRFENVSRAKAPTTKRNEKGNGNEKVFQTK